MKYLILLTVFVGCFVPDSAAQVAKDYGFREHSIETKALGVVRFYVSDTLHKQPKPLLIYLDGSGVNPLSYYKKDSTGKLIKYSGVPLNIRALKLKYHVLLISKPNTPFAKELSNKPSFSFDSLYNQYLSCDWRVMATSLAIKYVLRHYPIDKRKVIVLGHSEGGSVAPRVAVANKKVTHCIAVSSNGLNQFFDPIIQYRLLENKGAISSADAQSRIDSLFNQFREIYKNPDRTDLLWYGHTYKRWSSFTQKATLDYFKELAIPTLVIHGSIDDNVQVLSADYARLEMLRLGKTNVAFRNYPGLDHTFNNPKTGENSFFKVLDDAIKWAETQ